MRVVEVFERCEKAGVSQFQLVAKRRGLVR